MRLGKSVLSILKKLKKYYREADIKKHPSAALRLGLLLLARNKEEDVKNAVNFIKIAADYGVKEAQNYTMQKY